MDRWKTVGEDKGVPAGVALRDPVSHPHHGERKATRRGYLVTARTMLNTSADANIQVSGGIGRIPG